MSAESRIDDGSPVWRLLYETTKEINRSLSTAEVLDDILDRGLEAVGAELGWISVVRSNAGDKWLEMVAARGFDLSNAPRQGRFELGEGLSGSVAVTGEARYAADVATDEKYVEILPEIRSELVVPLVVHGEVTGVLNVESKEADGFSEFDREIIEALAEAAALAITNAERHAEVADSLNRTVKELERKARDMTALARVSSAVNSPTDLDEVLHLIIDTARFVALAHRGQLLLVDEGTGELVMHTRAELIDGSADGSRRGFEGGITGWVAKNKKSQVVADVSKDPRYEKWLEDTRSEVAVPLVSGGELMGVLNLESPALAHFGAEHVELLEILADHAVVAIRNARLFEELHRAQQRAIVAERLSAIGEVAGDMIHWVANRAGLVPGAVAAIREELADMPESVAEELEVIDRNAREVLRLKRTVLGAPEEGRTSEVGLEGTIMPIVEKVAGGLQVSVHIPEAADRVAAAAGALERVLTALVENAAQACGEGGQLEIEAVREWKNAGSRIALTVADSGPGVTTEMRRRIFNPFFSTRRGSGGTGMGLWLAYRAASRMGGELTLLAGTGKLGGAVFRLELPAYT